MILQFDHWKTMKQKLSCLQLHSISIIHLFNNFIYMSSLIGIAISIIGHSCNGLGMNLQRYAHTISTEKRK